MYYNENTTVFLNGKWLKASEAKTDLYAQTLHYGNGVFEGIRSYDTEDGVQVFKAKEHYERLLYSAQKMHINMNYTVEELTSLTYELLEKNNLKDAYIRPLVYLGANMSLQPTEEVNVFLCAWEWGKYLGNDLLNLMTSSYQRPNPKSCHVEAKVVGHYTNSILATTEAKSKGFDEALLLDAKGNVAEGPGANFFYEKDGVIYTSPLGNILPGITRSTVIGLAKELNFKVVEKYFTPEEVKGADGAFFTGTAAEVAGIASLDGVNFKMKWEDTMGSELARMYKHRVSSREYKSFDLV
ncbi:branched-chain amino acid transaminase [Vicingus serpentipes]|jgi:branched-chain amino acid aminotransferase|uniref:Branched-chain-amino-acid aminotransferase n=1 Tax=Vicingus serpentipes TaxID=1926625 RepID=A0A5C6RUP1_9FLAO|nr:branched-chain amino acid transaminase [Vicingus serpentipes]TXB65734.1 branched-chain amino acid transaminase [Vicingus serpentipes]